MMYQSKQLLKMILLSIVFILFMNQILANENIPNFQEQIRSVPGNVIGKLTDDEFQKINMTGIIPDRVIQLIKNVTAN